HSATKYLGGHDDVTLGLVISAREQAHRPLWKHAVDLGVAADLFAAWLTLRGLKTLPLRMERHCANAAHLAGRLAAHPAATAVHWPGLPDHPDNGPARRILAGFGGMIAFDLAGGREAGLAFVTGLRLAALATSLGGAETLVLHPASTSHRQMDAATLRASGIGEGSVRVSVGLEHPDDLWADFEQALAAREPAHGGRAAVRLERGPAPAGPGGAGDGAAPLDEDQVAPAAVQVADPCADAHHAEALPLVQAEAGGVLREDAGLDGPDPGGLGGADQRLHQGTADALPARLRRHVHRVFHHPGVRATAGDLPRGNPPQQLARVARGRGPPPARALGPLEI